MKLRRHLGADYSPLYFLAALGNGGLAVTFFIYLMFMVPHPQTPIITFDALYPYALQASLPIQGLIGLALFAMAFFGLRHLRMLAWNLRELKAFAQTPSFDQLKRSNAEVQLMAVPLTLAMTINVFFALGATFVPGLWTVVEYLFPFALLAFGAVGALALYIFLDFFGRVLSKGHFDCTRNNNLSQMLAIFAFAMVGVGFAASTAMSHVTATIVIGALGSILFLSAAIFLGLVKIVLGFRGMLEHGIAKEASVSLWIVIPILTLMGIAFIRIDHGMHTLFHSESSDTLRFLLTSSFLGLQVMFGLLGFVVMRKVGYFADFLRGPEQSPGSYALICPGVGFFVFGMFFLTLGLVKTGLMDKFSLMYFIVLLPLILVQAKTILTMFKLDNKLLRA